MRLWGCSLAWKVVYGQSRLCRWAWQLRGGNEYTPEIYRNILWVCRVRDITLPLRYRFVLCYLLGFHIQFLYELKRFFFCFVLGLFVCLFWKRTKTPQCTILPLEKNLYWPVFISKSSWRKLHCMLLKNKIWKCIEYVYVEDAVGSHKNNWN